MCLEDEGNSGAFAVPQDLDDLALHDAIYDGEGVAVELFLHPTDSTIPQCSEMVFLVK